MSIFDALFGTQKNPADAAMPYLNKIPGELHSGYDFYTGIGRDPAAYLQQLMGSYEPSKSYQLKLDEALKAAGNSAAAGGMRGSPEDLKNTTRITDRLLGEDMQQWLDNIFKEQGLGFQAQRDLTGSLSNLYGTQAGLGFQGQSQKNANDNGLLSGLFGLGGALLGGPVGGSISKWL